MIFDLDPGVSQLFKLIGMTGEDLHFPSFLVGGYVRDKILGRPCQDIDIVCVGSGIRLANAVAEQLKPRPDVAVYKRFGTAMFNWQDYQVEFVGARKESYRKDSRKPVVEDGTLDDDQNRRDFTINAMAVSLNADNYGELIDPFDGLNDLKKGILRTPREPGKTFSDDPLRMMRAIRFSAQLDFNIEGGTYQAISKNRSRIGIVSHERITGELQKIMMCPRPSKGFTKLFHTGLLKLIFPELAELQGVDIRRGKGHKDNFYHTLEVLDNLCAKSDNIWLRWAALLHDIGKPATKRFDSQVGWTFHGHDAVGAAMVPRIFRKLRLPLDQKMKYVRKLVRLHLRPISLTKENITDSAVRRLLFDAGDEIDDLMLLCEADITSKNPDRVARYRENYDLVREKMAEVEAKDELRNWEPPISGEIIMKTFGLKPSREVGVIKTAIREAILDGQIANDYEQAYAFMIRTAKEELDLEPVSG